MLNLFTGNTNLSSVLQLAPDHLDALAILNLKFDTFVCYKLVLENHCFC